MKKFFPLDSPFEFIEFHPTGSIGNQESFKYWQSETGRKKIVCSDLSHSSVIRFSPDDVVILKSRENFLLDEQEVNNYIQNNYQDIAVFVATGGLTSLGIVEKIAPSTYQLLKKYDIPIHADCAYGGFNIGLQRDNSQSKQEILKLMEISDSVSIDAHKFIGADNFNIVLFKEDEEEHLETYFDALQKNSTSGLGKQGKLFHEHLKQIPQKKFREFIENKLQNIRFFRELLEEYGFQVLSNPDVDQITISFNSKEEMLYTKEWLKKTEFINVASGELGNNKVPYIRMVFSNYYNFSWDFFIDLVASLRGIQDNINGQISSDTVRLSRSGYQIKVQNALKHYFPRKKVGDKKFEELPKLVR